MGVLFVYRVVAFGGPPGFVGPYGAWVSIFGVIFGDFGEVWGFFWPFPVIPRNHAKRFGRFSIVLALLVDYYGVFGQFGAI